MYSKVGGTSLGDSLGVRVIKIKEEELQQLHTIIEALKDAQYQSNVIEINQDIDYVVTIDSVTLSKLKEVLRGLLQIVDADRIKIDT